MPPAPKLLATLVLLAGLAPFGHVAMAAASGSGTRDAHPPARSPAPAPPGPAAAPPATGATPAAAPVGAEPLAFLPAEPATPAPSSSGSAPGPGGAAAPEPPAEAPEQPDDEDAAAPVKPEASSTPAPPRPPSEMPAGDGFDEPAEDAFRALTNDSRHAAGVAALAWDHELTAYARRHARYLATNGHLEHSDIRTLLDAWSTVGENVGVGPSVGTIQEALVASPDHYRNLADPLFTHVGVGVFVDAEGRTWTAHVFGV